MCDELVPEQPDLTDEQWAATLPPRLTRRGFLAGALGATAGALLLPELARARTTAAKFPLPTGTSTRVLITGDAGTGLAEQYAVATAARKLHADRPVDLAIGLGDNVYEDGVESSTDDEFDSKFEQPNSGLDVPWLMVLGNHDCSGLIPGSGGYPARGDYQVAYHEYSPRWYLPQRYYSVPLPASRPVVEFFALDTNPVASYVMQTDPYYYWNGPYMRAQRDWLVRGLASSPARWKIVMTHHPYRNNGPHGNAGAYDGITLGDYTSGIHLKELFEEVVCGRAQFILSGHDHSSQVLTGAATPASRGTEQIVCGASGKSVGGDSNITNPYHWQEFSSHGFMVMTIRPQHVAVEAYLVDVGTATARLAYTHLREA